MNKNTTEITPSERLTRLSDIENAKWLIDSIVAECSGEMWVIDGLMLLIEAIVTKGKKVIEIRDFAEDLQIHLFNQTADHSKQFVDYKEKAARGRKYGFWEEEEESEPAILDLSACQPEQLNTRISELTAPNDLACVLSGLLHNPKLPKEIYNGIAESLANVSSNQPEQAFDSPEYISIILRNSEESE